MGTERLRSRLILDTSVAIKWYLDDEDFTPQARDVLREYTDGSFALLAPDHIRYEIANAIRLAVRSGREHEDVGRQKISHFLALRIPTVRNDGLIRSAYDFALRYHSALYDGLYLALAHMAQCPFVHADRRLHNTLAGNFEHELWIANFG